MEDMPTVEEAARRQIDRLRYMVRYVPISERRNRILEDIGKLKRYLKHPRGPRINRNDGGESDG